MKKLTTKILIQRIEKFISTYANVSPNYEPGYDDIDDKYTSPDAYEFLKTIQLLKLNCKVDYVFSELG